MLAQTHTNTIAHQRIAGSPALSPATAVGVSLALVSPVPSCPRSFSPQQSTPPPVSRAHVW